MDPHPLPRSDLTLTDGSPVVGVLMPFDADTLAERGVPLDAVGDHGALLLSPGYLQGQGLGGGDVIALGLAGDRLLLESVPEPVMTAETVAGLGRRWIPAGWLTTVSGSPRRDSTSGGGGWRSGARRSPGDMTSATTPSRSWRSSRCMTWSPRCTPPLAPRPARPALLWLRGRAHARLADLTRAEAAYHAAESVDPQWPPTLVDLARFAGDLGDTARGLALLRRAGTPPDHVLVELLERFQARPRVDLGRNQSCWCGSGRKYKKCYLHHEQLPLDERAAWLYQKAGMFLLDGPWRGAVVEAAAKPP